MARNSEQEMNFESYIRRIVREEVRSMFDGFGEEESNEPTILGASDDSSDNTGTTRKRRRRKSAGANTKGRVTNPNDKRLKANRELNS